jgi:DNA primase
MGGIVKGREPLKGSFKEKKKKEDGMRQSQKLLLTWMIENEKAFEIIRQYISPEDFTEELFRRTARILYQQKKHGEIKAADIISTSEDEEEAREIAELFHAKLNEIETNAEKEKALKETIVRVKQNSLDYRFKHLSPDDSEKGNQLLAEKLENEKLKNLHISID